MCVCLSLFLYLGGKFGTFIGTVLSGLISGSDLLGGWPMTYYAFGKDIFTDQYEHTPNQRF